LHTAVFGRDHSASDVTALGVLFDEALIPWCATDYLGFTRALYVLTLGGQAVECTAFIDTVALGDLLAPIDVRKATRTLVSLAANGDVASESIDPLATHDVTVAAGRFDAVFVRNAARGFLIGLRAQVWLTGSALRIPRTLALQFATRVGRYVARAS